MTFRIGITLFAALVLAGCSDSSSSRAPDLSPELASLFTDVRVSGGAPSPLTKLVIISLDKPGEDPSSCKAKRPISLINSVAKILEAVVLHRLLPLVEPHLCPNQFAYRAGRGAEMHLAELSDFAADHVREGHYI